MSVSPQQQSSLSLTSLLRFLTRDGAGNERKSAAAEHSEADEDVGDGDEPEGIPVTGACAVVFLASRCVLHFIVHAVHPHRTCTIMQWTAVISINHVETTNHEVRV